MITEPQSDRYIASNPKYPGLRIELEMFGSGKPKITDWKLMKDALSGIGLLQYYAGDYGEGQDNGMEYVAIVDIRANKVLSVEPHSWGSAPAQWNWQAVSVVVTDPDGNANEVQLRKVVRRAAPVDREGGFFDFGQGAADSGASSEGAGGAGRRATRRGGGGGGGGMFDWLFHH